MVCESLHHGPRDAYEVPFWRPIGLSVTGLGLLIGPIMQVAMEAPAVCHGTPLT
jgi:hypothetical protein